MRSQRQSDRTSARAGWRHELAVVLAVAAVILLAPQATLVPSSCLAAILADLPRAARTRVAAVL